MSSSAVANYVENLLNELIIEQDVGLKRGHCHEDDILFTVCCLVSKVGVGVELLDLKLSNYPIEDRVNRKTRPDDYRFLAVTLAKIEDHYIRIHSIGSLSPRITTQQKRALPMEVVNCSTVEEVIARINPHLDNKFFSVEPSDLSYESFTSFGFASSPILKNTDALLAEIGLAQLEGRTSAAKNKKSASLLRL